MSVEDRSPSSKAWKGFDPEAVISPKWLIDGLVPERSVCCVYGPPNTGKTFLVLDMALSIATGRHWLGLETRVRSGRQRRAGQVVYILGEGPDGLNRRIAGWLKHHNIPRELWEDTLKGRLFIPSIQNLSLNKPSHIQRLAEQIRENCDDVALIIFDPLVSYMNGDENNAQDMHNLIVGLRSLIKQFECESDCSALIVHHQGKSWGKAERGSSALRGGVETHLRLSPSKQDTCTLTVEKQRDGVKAQDIRLRFLAMKGFDSLGEECDLGKVTVQAEMRLSDSNDQCAANQIRDKNSNDLDRCELSSANKKRVNRNHELIINAVKRLERDGSGLPITATRVANILRDNPDFDLSNESCRLILNKLSTNNLHHPRILIKNSRKSFGIAPEYNTQAEAWT